MARKHGQGAVLQPQSALGRDPCAYCTGKSEDEAITELKQRRAGRNPNRRAQAVVPALAGES
jgi:hypothetical protein